MERMVWNEAWETGDHRVDSQHRAMVRNINRLVRRLDEGRGMEGMNKAITFLMMYVETHFQEEEVLMAQAGFPGLADHVASHRACACRVESLLEGWREQRPGVLEELVGFLAYWLAQHLETADRSFSVFMGTRPAILEPAIPGDPCPSPCAAP